MTDHEFSALESRMAPVLAAGSSREYRREVGVLLAECRRLREPPDVAGLLPAADLAEMRTWTSLGGKWLRLLFAHIDAQAALVRELYGVVADLHADDPGRQRLMERGRAEGRHEAAVLLGALGMHEAAGRVRALLTPCRPPLPPQEAEREAERLREALAWVVQVMGHSPGIPLGAADRAEVGAASARALGGDAR